MAVREQPVMGTTSGISGADAGSGPRVRAARSEVGESDGYERSVAGIDIHAIRTGVGGGPNRVSVVTDGVVTATSCDIGFPIMTRTTIGDERFIIGGIRTSAGSRWCGLDLEDGSVVAYGPGAEHTGANNEGLSFAFTVASREALDERAHTLGARIELPVAGMVLEIGARPGLDAWVELDLGPHGISRSRNAEQNLDEILSAMVLAFRQPLRSPRPSRGPRRWDDREIVHRCIDLAEALERRPTLSELCAVSRVSERRLRTAFASQFDTSPAAFFRLWALTVARRRLSDVDGSDHTVTRTSLDLGFGHLSRFAQYYQQVYGESPSVTARGSRLPPRL